MKWLIKNLILGLMIILAFGFGASVWWMPGVIGGIFLFLSLFSFWGELVIKHLRAGTLVFILATVLFGAAHFSFLLNAESSATAATEIKSLQAIAKMSENTADAYDIKMKALVDKQRYYLSRGEMDSAGICSDAILLLRERALAAQKPFEKLLRKDGDISVSESQKSEGTLREVATFLIFPGDSTFVTDFVMVPFATYELKGFVGGEPSRYEMEYCGPGNQAMIREMASTAYWKVNGIPGNLTVKRMPSDTLVIQIKRVV